MQARRRQWHTWFAAGALALMVVAWVALAPPLFGGKSTFIIVNGNSMEPGMHRGDLAIVRVADGYQIGDVVTYRHPTIGPVIHRIIARDGDHFIFQGDNNSWVDSYHPTREELIGKLWLFVPSAGKWMDQLRSPRTIALLVFVMGIMHMTTATSEHDRRRQRLQRYAEELRAASADERPPIARAERRSVRARPPAATQPGGGQEILLAVLTILACLSLLLALFSFTRPLERTVTDNVTYTQTGTFEYSANAPAGVYDTSTLRTGEPIFRKLVSQVRMGFTYRFAGDLSHQLAGSYRLLAEVGASDGWKRVIELQPATSFTGDGFVASGKLDLAAVQALIDEMQRQTKVQRQQYTLAVVPEMNIAGTFGGQVLQDTFAPRLVFQVDELELQIMRDTAADADPLAPTKQGTLKRSRSEPNTIGLLGLSLGVMLMRWLAAGLVVLCTAGALLVGRKVALAKLVDEPARIKGQYGALLIAVHDSELATADRLVEVASFEDLARLAERDERMILYERCGPEHHYVVQIAGVNYHYRAVEVGGIQALVAGEHER